MDRGETPRNPWGDDIMCPECNPKLPGCRWSMLGKHIYSKGSDGVLSFISLQSPPSIVAQPHTSEAKELFLDS